MHRAGLTRLQARSSITARFAATPLTATPVAPSFTRAALSTVSVVYQQETKSNYAWIAAAATTGVALTALTVNNKVYAADVETKNTEAQLQPKWTELVKGNYDNRIREWSTPEKVFGTFASVKKDDGDYYMTLNDFCSAVLPFDYRSKAEQRPIREVPDFIKLADMDRDQLISFGEYLFFVTLLGIPEKHFRAAFAMFDLDGSGRLSQGEFKNVMHVLRQSSPYASKQREKNDQVENAGLFSYFFGAGGNTEITYEQFSEFLHKLKDGVLNMEFERYASPEDSTKMTARNFAMAVVSYAHPAEVPHFLSRVNSLLSTPQTVSFDEFKAFNRALAHIEDIALAIQLYATGGEVNKQDFVRAVQVVAKQKLSPLQVDIIFHVFDTDGNGKLNAKELLSVMKKRADRGLSHNRDTGIALKAECVWACITGKPDPRNK